MRISLLPILCVFVLTGCSLLDSSPTFEITDLGLHYYFHEQLDDIKPEVGDEIYYMMTLRRRGKVLSSKKKKELMPLSPKKNPILQAFKLMGLGDSVTIALFVDSLPQRMTQQFEPGDTMFIDLKILDVRKKTDFDSELSDMQEKADRIQDHIRVDIGNFLTRKLKYKTTASGLKYIIEKEGNGKTIKNAKSASLHYAGYLLKGKEFVSTFRRGTSKKFYFDHRTQTVAGFTEGLKLLSAGSKATFIIPHRLAYGEKGRGPIPPASDIVIYVEVLEVD